MAEGYKRWAYVGILAVVLSLPVEMLLPLFHDLQIKQTWFCGEKRREEKGGPTQHMVPSFCCHLKLYSLWTRKGRGRLLHEWTRERDEWPGQKEGVFFFFKLQLWSYYSTIIGVGKGEEVFFLFEKTKKLYILYTNTGMEAQSFLALSWIIITVVVVVACLIIIIIIIINYHLHSTNLKAKNKSRAKDISHKIKDFVS